MTRNHIRILGIDPGPKQCGFASLYLDDGNVRFGSVDIVQSNHLDVARWMGSLFSWDIVAIERPRGIAFNAKGGGVVPALMDTAFVAGLCAGIAGNRTVVTATANEWRKAIVGKAAATDAQVKVAISRLVKGWPTRSNSHHRDAAGIACFAARQVMAKAA